MALWTVIACFIIGYSEEPLTPCPTCEQLDYPLSAVRDCLFIQHTDSCPTKADWSIHNLRTPSDVVAGTH